MGGTGKKLLGNEHLGSTRLCTDLRLSCRCGDKPALAVPEHLLVGTKAGVQVPMNEPAFTDGFPRSASSCNHGQPSIHVERACRGIVRGADGGPLYLAFQQLTRLLCCSLSAASATMWRPPPSRLSYSRDGEALWHCFELTERCQLCPKEEIVYQVLVPLYFTTCPPETATGVSTEAQKIVLAGASVCKALSGSTVPCPAPKGFSWQSVENLACFAVALTLVFFVVGGRQIHFAVR